MTELNNGKAVEKWNVVYNKTTAGTVSQEKIDMIRKSLKENPEINEMIWDIELKPDSPDELIARYLFLIGETLETEDIEIELDEVSKV